MRDINDIVENNNRTWGPVIDNLIRQGRYVVAQYDGLHLVAVESFSDLHAAQDEAERVRSTVGSRSELHFPLQLASRAADHLARINDPTGRVGGAVIVNQPARVPLQGDPDSFAYRHATRREEQRQANQSLTALQAAALARPRDLSLETENTADRVFERIAAELAREAPSSALSQMTYYLTREERDRVAEGGLVSQEV